MLIFRQFNPRTDRGSIPRLIGRSRPITEVRYRVKRGGNTLGTDIVYYNDTLNSLKRAWEKLPNIGENELDRGIVCFIGGKLIGIAGALYEDSYGGRGKFDLVVLVAQDFEKRKIGTNLLRQLLENIAEEGLPNFSLNIILRMFEPVDPRVTISTVEERLVKRVIEFRPNLSYEGERVVLEEFLFNKVVRGCSIPANRINEFLVVQ